MFNFSMGADEALLTLGKEPRGSQRHKKPRNYCPNSWVIFLDARTSFVSCEKESKKKKNEFLPSINPALSCSGLLLQGSILSANTTVHVVPACVDSVQDPARGREVALDAASLENRNEWFGWFCTKRTAPG
ncbi:hypothetical protein GE21DRAFT_1307300 [Neurospora crassa]|nr:hypothetical protein GE21DRAFT_1307300 [Neurospora crassa]